MEMEMTKRVKTDLSTAKYFACEALRLRVRHGIYKDTYVFGQVLVSQDGDSYIVTKKGFLPLRVKIQKNWY